MIYPAGTVPVLYIAFAVTNASRLKLPIGALSAMGKLRVKEAMQAEALLENARCQHVDL